MLVYVVFVEPTSIRLVSFNLLVDIRLTNFFFMVFLFYLYMIYMIYKCVSVYVYVYMKMYIYIYREREMNTKVCSVTSEPTQSSSRRVSSFKDSSASP